MAKRDVVQEMLHKFGQEVSGERTQEALLSPERIATAYRRVFSGQDGEIVLADLRAKFNGTTVQMRAAGIDPYATHFREGQRAVYLALCEAQEPPVPVIYDEEIV